MVPGTVVKVECSKPEYLKKGSSEVTCTSGADFTHKKEPQCSMLGRIIFARAGEPQAMARAQTQTRILDFKALDALGVLTYLCR